MSHVEGDAIVTDRQASDENLRAAFQSLGETSREEPSPEDLERIWRAVGDELPASERRELVDRMATDAGLAEAWRAAREMRGAAPGETTVEKPPARFWTASWLAAAAVLLVSITAGLVFQLSSTPRDTFRDGDHYVIESAVPSEATLPRDDFRLRWTAGPQDSRYQVRVTKEDLQVLTTVSDLTVPELVLAPDLLASVPSGGRIFWQVDVTLPGREGSASSPTFIVRVQ
jgi:hypothetical protein